MADIVKLTDQTFDETIGGSDKPVLVDFWAEWCGPCKQIAPALEELAGEKGEAIRVVKVDIDENPLTPTKYGVRGIPTLMVFTNGEVTDTRVGAMAKSKLYEWVESLL